jgi:hypothetical protein
VNDEYISLLNWGRTDCGGHPDGDGKWSVERLGDLARTPIAYGDMEGKGASDEYERRAAHALIDQNIGFDKENHEVLLGERSSEDDRDIRRKFPNWSTMNDLEKAAAMETVDDLCFPKHDDKEWYIMRNHGQWSAYGNFDTHRLCGVEVDFELPFHASFAAPATAPISLDAIPISLGAIRNRKTIIDITDLKTFTNNKDLYWSPNHGFLVVLVDMDMSCINDPFNGCPPREHWEAPSQTLLQVYSPHGQDIGKPVISMRLKDFEEPVMAEWATGSNVERWTTELKKIKAQGVVKPLLSSSPHP